MIVFLKAKWENIIMVNYEIDPKILQPFLPSGVFLDLFNGKAYVSLVGFIFKKTKLFRIPIPWFGSFEEINLRFYVVRKEGNEMKRGVVFINETIPYKVVAWMANKLYNEHYTVVKTKHKLSTKLDTKSVNFEWLLNKKWNSIYVESEPNSNATKAGSLENFIFEHYYGYTKLNQFETEEYQLNHPSWETYNIVDYNINCDFKAMYGDTFSILNETTPTAVFIAKGSDVEIYWKRTKIMN